MKILHIKRNVSALVDDEDYERLSLLRWHLSSGYAAHGRYGTKLHHMILDVPVGYEVDHIDRNKLNNQKNNLRVTTRSINQQNAPKPTNRAGFRGVKLCRDKYHARITINGEYIHLGAFKTKEEAARAYDTKARELYGEHALTNFPNV